MIVLSPGAKPENTTTAATSVTQKSVLILFNAFPPIFY